MGYKNTDNQNVSVKYFDKNLLISSYKHSKPDCNGVLENNQQALQSNHACEYGRLITDYGAQYYGVCNDVCSKYLTQDQIQT